MLRWCWRAVFWGMVVFGPVMVVAEAMRPDAGAASIVWDGLFVLGMLASLRLARPLFVRQGLLGVYLGAEHDVIVERLLRTIVLERESIESIDITQGLLNEILVATLDDGSRVTLVSATWGLTKRGHRARLEAAREQLLRTGGEGEGPGSTAPPHEPR